MRRHCSSLSTGVTKLKIENKRSGPGIIVVGFGNKLGGDCMEGAIVTPLGVEAVGDGVDVFEP